MLISIIMKELLRQRSSINSKLDVSEDIIMGMIRGMEDPTDEVYYREYLKSNAYDVQEQINNEQQWKIEF